MMYSRLALLIALPVATAFGPATPLNGAVSNNQQQQLTMRVGLGDMKRRGKITTLLDHAVVPGDDAATKAAIQSTLLNDQTEAMVEKLNWKRRKAMIRKVRNLAGAYDVPMDASYGIPTPRLEREATEAAAAVIRRTERAAHFDTVKADRDERVAARRAAESGSDAEKKKKMAAAAQAVQEAEDAKAAEEAAEAAAAKAKYDATMANEEEKEAADAETEAARAEEADKKNKESTEKE